MGAIYRDIVDGYGGLISGNGLSDSYLQKRAAQWQWEMAVKQRTNPVVDRRKICGRCGKRYEPRLRDTHSKWCVGCRPIVYREQDRARRGSVLTRQMITKACPHCCQEFTFTDMGQGEAKTRIYCGPKCCLAAKKARAAMRAKTA